MESKKFDYKKEYKDLYLPKNKPMIIKVPIMTFIMINGTKDPNNNKDFQNALEMLYGISFTIKMSKKKGNQPKGYFEYVVPPLEGLWWIEEGNFSFFERENWKWTLMIRQPDFVDETVFKWACQELKAKKSNLNIEKIRLEQFEEGLSAQIMHKGPYNNEPQTIKELSEFIKKENLLDKVEIGGKHHEIYLSDPRKSKPENLKTVIRHPVYK